VEGHSEGLQGKENPSPVRIAFRGYSGEPISNRAFNSRLRSACRALGWETAHGLRHSPATIFVNHVEKGLREIQELLRHKNIRTPCAKPRGYEQTRQTAEALSRPLGLLASKAPRPPKASSSRIRRHLPRTSISILLWRWLTQFTDDELFLESLEASS
jgi:hypothetical protein